MKDKEKDDKIIKKQWRILYKLKIIYLYIT
jgi:hypothetical protein